MRFRQADAFALLDEPGSGDVRTITVLITVDGGEQELTYDARIVGP